MQKKLTLSLATSLLLTTSFYAKDELSSISVSTATKSEQSIKDVTSNIEIITSAEIEEKNYLTVGEALNSLSNISVDTNGGLGSATSVRLRGMDSRNILVLIDGIRYNDVTGTSGASFEHIIMTDIKQIEVIKGAQSGIWGADASAGVINIITNGPKEGVHGKVVLEAGSYNMQKYLLNSSYKTNIFYISGTLSKIKNDGFSSYVPTGKDADDYEKDEYENITKNVKAGLFINDNNKLEITHTLVNTEGEYDGGATSTTAKQILKANDNASKKDSANRYSKINFTNQIDKIKTNIYANKSVFNRRSGTSESDGSVKEFGFKVVAPYYNKKSFFVTGADFKQYAHDNTLNKEYESKGLFLTNSNKFNKTIITESVRLDSYDTFEDKTTGKLGVKHNYAEDIYVSFNVGTAYTVPTPYQLFAPGFTSYGTFYNVGNANLKPQNTTSVELRTSYKGLTLTYYKNEIKDLIDYGSGYENIDGKSILKGYEVSYKKSILDTTLLALEYSTLNAKNKDGEILKRRPSERLKASIDYYGLSKFHFNLSANYVGTRFNKDNKEGTQTGRYTVWNSVINYKVNKNLSTYLKLDNIGNKVYQESEGYATPERSAYLGLKASF